MFRQGASSDKVCADRGGQRRGARRMCGGRCVASSPPRRRGRTHRERRLVRCGREERTRATAATSQLLRRHSKAKCNEPDERCAAPSPPL
eukprot:3833297-Prymnesium_polylepis.3